MEHQDVMEHQEQRETRVTLEHQELLAVMEHQAHREHLDLLVWMEPQAHQDELVWTVHQEHTEHLALKVWLEDQEHQIGPVAVWRLNEDWSLYTGALFGATDATPDSELRLRVTRAY